MVTALTPRSFVRIPVAVTRLSSGDELLGWERGRLKMRLVAGPAKGRDDEAVEALLADVLDIERARVRVVLGRGSRRKWVEIDDYDELELDRRLPGRTRESVRGEAPGRRWNGDQEMVTLVMSDGSLSAPSALNAVATK